MSDIKMKLEGVDELRKALKSLHPLLAKKAYLKTIGDGGEVICKAAKSYCRVRKAAKGAERWSPGLLKKSLKVKTVIYQGVHPVAIIGPDAKTQGKPVIVKMRNGKTRTVIPRPSFYSHLVEFGTSHSPAYPFIRPAVESTTGAVVDVMANNLDKNLDKIVRAMERRMKK